MVMDKRPYLLYTLLGVAATLIIFLLSLHLPFVGAIIIIITPLPVMVLCHRLGYRGAILAVLIATLVVSAISSPILGFVFFAEFGLFGILMYHYVFDKKMPWDRGILVSSLIVLTLLSVLVVVMKTATSLTLSDWVRQEIHQRGRDVLQLYAAEGTNDPSLGLVSEKLARLVLRILPALIILSIWVEGLVNVSLFARVTRQMSSGRGQVIMKPDFRNWICPDWLVWGAIAGGFLMVTRVPSLVTIGLNTVILVLAIFFLQGIAIISFFFKQRNVPLGFRVVGYILIATIQLLLIVVAALGLFDIWIDFRKTRPKIASTKGGS
jgi:uncharacterized protein YybS (DUF2232 family)